ncbi:ketopantoate reductase family protein [Caryophanon latum]|uniref:2-dehydropantoate 2-reductase n=1 Tax=Caryophanon latum TaxID=33977 RepID=A0A1C0YB84_9BACL|nr:2-dehydropantoate 2-reductase [Caryophanon latum]OCS84393.1 hypothetical protein A6K76_03120 [Caryophanon latum]
MNIIVYGAGAIGAYFGGRFAEAGANVTFFVRERRAAQLANGLTIESPEGNFHAHVHTATTVNDVTAADVIIVAVKGYHFKDALPQIVELANKTNAYVLPLLNGIEHVTLLRKSLGEHRVIGGFASIIATLNEQGHIIHSSKGSNIQIGALAAEQQPIVDELAAMSERMHTNVVAQSDIVKGMWKKYMLIAAFSGITSTTQQPASSMQHEATLNVAKTIVRELAQLAQLEGVSFTADEIEKEASRLEKFKGDVTSSMHQDLRKGLPLEVEHLHGGALRIAQKHDVTVPTIATVYGILQPYAHGTPTNE